MKIDVELLKHQLQEVAQCDPDDFGNPTIEIFYENHVSVWSEDVCFIDLVGKALDRIKELERMVATNSTMAEEIISDEEIEHVHGNANFGSMSKRQVVDQGVLKCASGYYQGYTSTRIITEHGLVDKEYNLTPKGKTYLWAAFSTEYSV